MKTVRADSEVFAGQQGRVSVADIEGARAEATLERIEAGGGTSFTLAHDVTFDAFDEAITPRRTPRRALGFRRRPIHAETR